MSSRIVCLILATAMGACAGRSRPAATAAGADSFRAEPPPPGPPPEFAVPVPERRVLENGLTMLVVSKRDLPLVHVGIVARGGSSADPAALPGLAGFFGDMLEAGTMTRSAQRLAEEIEALGASLRVEVDEDALFVGAVALTENSAAALEILADVVQRPAFLPEEIERVRRRRLAALAEERDDPDSLATRVFQQLIFGPHPYGHSVLGESEAIARIGRADLLAFAEHYLRPANVVILLVGDVAPAAAFAGVERCFGAWTGLVGPEPPPPAPRVQPPETVLVPRPEAPQSELRVGQLGVARSHPDYFNLLIMNAVLGGLFNSRINMNLREAKGYTYGAYSSFEFNRAPGAFVVQTAVRTDATVPAIREVLAEVDRMRREPVAAAELEDAKNSYALSLPAMFQTVDRLAAMMARIWIFDLPLDYYRQVPGRIRAVSADDVRRVASEHLDSEQLSIVVVGDPGQVGASLQKLGRGEVELWRSDGTDPAGTEPPVEPNLGP